MSVDGRPTAPAPPPEDDQGRGASQHHGAPPPADRPVRSLHQPALHHLVAAVCAPALSLSGWDGQIRREGAEGLYVDDVRALSELVVTVDGAEPVPLGCDIEGGSTNRFDAAVFEPGSLAADPVALVTRRRRLRPAGLIEDIEITSSIGRAMSLALEVRLAVDLAPLASVKSGRAPDVEVAARRDRAGRLAWPASGTSVVVVVAGSPPPGSVEAPGGRMRWDLTLAPRGRQLVSVSVDWRGTRRGAVLTAASRAARGRQHTGSRAGPGAETAAAELSALEVASSDARLTRFVERSLADLEALRVSTPEAPEDVFLAAGVPWFLALFGRDSLWAARMLLPLGTELALGTLRTLSARQGRAVDDRTGEEPGKILHELRRDATVHEAFAGGSRGAATLSLPPVYYGTVDATALWVVLLHDAWRYGAPGEAVEELLDPMSRCLEWIADFGISESGFVSYVDRSGHGLTNQGWKDSHDAIQFRDGTIAVPPLALCEVQAYAYQAAVDGAALLDAFGREGAGRWRDLAAALAGRFRSRFWVEDARGPYPAVALDARGAPVDSLSSNIGHLLGTGLLDERESELVAERLSASELDSGFGLRTLASSSAGFNPLGYHSGSVWAHDTAIAIGGLAATASTVASAAATSLIEGLLCSAESFDYRMPELYGGHQRGERRSPLPYPASCRPQAWAAAASIAVLSALVGLRPDVPRGTVVLAPLAGSPLTAGGLHVEGLQVDGSKVAVRLEPGREPVLEGTPAHLKVQVRTR